MISAWAAFISTVCGRLRVWNTGVYREIVEPERIACSDSFSDEKGNVVPAAYYGMSSDFPLEMLLTVTFEDHDGKTKFTWKTRLNSIVTDLVCLQRGIIGKEFEHGAIDTKN